MQSYVFSTKYQRNICCFDFFYYICSNINVKTKESMKRTGFLYRVFDLYYDGFRNMRLGKTLWAIILIKLFIIFAILKVFFFPNFIGEHADKGEEPEYVASEMIQRSE